MKLFSAALLLCSLLLSSSFLEPVMAKSSFCASCANAGIQDRCLRYCGICGEQCKCVPSGTYGKKHECPSGTYRNKHECPFETYQCPCYRDKHECPNMESTRRFHHRMISFVLFKPIVWLAICTAIPVLGFGLYKMKQARHQQTGSESVANHQQTGSESVAN